MRKSPIKHKVQQHSRHVPDGAITIQTYERGHGSRDEVPRTHKRPTMSPGKRSDYSVMMTFADREETEHVSAPTFFEAATAGMTKREGYELPLVVTVGVV